MNPLIALSNFLIYLRLHKGRSRKTQEQYAFHILRFIGWITRNPEILALRPRDILPPLTKDKNHEWHSPLSWLAQAIREPLIESIAKDDIDLWRISLADSRLSIKTTNAHMITLRSWFKYLKKEGIQSIDPTVIDLIRAPDREVTFLTDEEIKRFFEAVPTDTLIWKRDYAICECIYSTGLRISELTNLNKKDVNLETLEFAVRGKGNKLRVVYLTEDAKNAIAWYLSSRDDHFSPLFIRHNFSRENIKSSELDDTHVRLTRFFITNMIKTYGIKAGILKNLHAHTLRHSFATTLLTNWADIRIIQELLGHSSITTTQVYTHVTNPKLKEAHKKFHK